MRSLGLLNSSDHPKTRPALLSTIHDTSTPQSASRPDEVSKFMQDNIPGLGVLCFGKVWRGYEYKKKRIVIHVCHNADLADARARRNCTHLHGDDSGDIHAHREHESKNMPEGIHPGENYWEIPYLVTNAVKGPLYQALELLTVLI